MYHPEKYTSRPVVTATQLLGRFFPASQKTAAPQTVLILMDTAVYNHAKSRIWGRVQPHLPAKLCTPHRWRTPAPALLGGIGVGGAGVVAQLEYLAAWGVKRVVLLGAAGGLTPSVAHGDLIIPTRALRDDGVSAHYLPAAKWAFPSEPLASKLAVALKPLVAPIHLAPVWTTAAPFRETEAEVRDYAADGAVAVEMEAASLFAAAQRLGVAAAAVLVVSDSLAAGVHHVPDQKRVQTHQKLACDQLLKLFNS